MRRTWHWATLAVLAGVFGTARAGENSIGPFSPFNGAQSPAFRRWGGVSNEKPKPPPPPQNPNARSRAEETAGAVRAQEDANLLRRMAVCERLRSLALETGDESLEKQADSLQQKANSVYKQRTSAPTGGLAQNKDDSAREGKR